MEFAALCFRCHIKALVGVHMRLDGFGLSKILQAAGEHASDAMLSYLVALPMFLPTHASLALLCRAIS